MGVHYIRGNEEHFLLSLVKFKNTVLTFLILTHQNFQIQSDPSLYLNTKFQDHSVASVVTDAQRNTEKQIGLHKVQNTEADFICVLFYNRG